MCAYTRIRAARVHTRMCVLTIKVAFTLEISIAIVCFITMGMDVDSGIPRVNANPNAIKNKHKHVCCDAS